MSDDKIFWIKLTAKQTQALVHPVKATDAVEAVRLLHEGLSAMDFTDIVVEGISEDPEELFTNAAFPTEDDDSPAPDENETEDKKTIN